MVASMGSRADTPAPPGAPSVPLLVFVGPPGVGKTSAAKALTRLLDEAAISYSFVDRDEFGVGGLLQEDHLLALNEILHARVAAGAQRLIVAWRVESGMDVTRLRSALGWADVTICRLHAEPQVLFDRIAAGNESFQRLHLQAMAAQIAPRLAAQATEDLLLATDVAPPRAVAVRALRQWRQLPVTAPATTDSATPAV
jgi:dephospho-CoA kinase